MLSTVTTVYIACTLHNLCLPCRQFEEKNLGQMKTVYPTAFNFRQEKNIPGLFDKRNKYHLTVECRVEDEEQSSVAAEPKNGVTKKITKGALNATTLIKRRKRFN